MPRRPRVHLDKAGREEADGALFRAALDGDPIGELRMALHQNQPIGVGTGLPTYGCSHGAG